MADKTYYFIAENFTRVDPAENDGQAWRPERQYLTTNLQPLYSKYSNRFTDLEQFTEAMLESTTAQRIAGIELRAATAKDLKDFESDLEVIEAVQAFRDADQVALVTKRKSQVQVSKWFSENVGTKDEVEAFVKLHRLNPFQFATWIKAAEEQAAEDGTTWKASKESLTAFYEYWSGKNLALTGSAKDKAVKVKSFVELRKRVEGK